jgi:two-component system, OmpR family, lantibiotic biosynthesis response regulator NisR/SpaR
VASRPARVLFVEDDEVLAMVVSRHLRARGHDARTVAWAEQAIELLKSGFRPSIVLLDINLPGASGWDLLRNGALTEAGAPPVYIVSATSVSPARLREFNVAGFLPKPFPMETLVDIVERAAEGSDRSTEVLEDPMATSEQGS